MKKNFDCVYMKYWGATQVRAQTEAMTREQEMRFWQERSSELRQRQATLQIHTTQTNHAAAVIAHTM